MKKTENTMEKWTKNLIRQCTKSSINGQELMVSCSLPKKCKLKHPFVTYRVQSRTFVAIVPLVTTLGKVAWHVQN